MEGMTIEDPDFMKKPETPPKKVLARDSQQANLAKKWKTGVGPLKLSKGSNSLKKPGR